MTRLPVQRSAADHDAPRRVAAGRLAAVGLAAAAAIALVTPAVAASAAGTHPARTAAASGHAAARQAGPGATGLAGSLQSWGENVNGELGVGMTSSDSNVPDQVNLPANTTVTAVATGGKHSLAITSTGQLLAWGDNFYGQLGDGSNTDSATPVLVHLPKGTRVTAIAAGGSHSLAVTADGHVYAWGEDQYGQLGDGSTVASNVPMQVRLPKGVRVATVGASYNCSLALTRSGQVLAWGYNGSGQLGNGFHTASEVPVRVRLPKGVKATALVSSGYDGLVITSAGRLISWGDNSRGQLGDGTKISSALPVLVKLPKGTKIVAIGAGSQHSVALTSTGKVLAWGYNKFGQLGNGATVNSDVPVAVHLPAGVTVTAVTAGGGYSLALTSDGRVLAWGHNEDGQLGDGAMASTKTPVFVKLPAGLTAVGLAACPTTRHNLLIVQQATP